MSLKPVHIVHAPFFYPAGNTPAVCLTQSLPLEQDAALLLLGCGDIRNILFTIYSEPGMSAGRRLDFTCCDLEAEIIARNILALTLIVDDTKGARVQQLWNIYYHIFVDTDSFNLLQSQAKKLLALARSMEVWNESPYAKLVRFCDTTTLENVTKLWEFYAIEQSQVDTYKEAQEMLKSQWKAAKRFKGDTISDKGISFDGVRSSAPLLFEGLQDVANLYQTYWQSGTCFEDKKVIKKLTIANPMFACHRSGLILHYGTSPLTGFHLASVYARLSSDSPMADTGANGSTKQAMPKAMQVTMRQLSDWCAAFRAALSRVTIRYVNADAIAFCHVLQHHQTQNESNTAYWFRNIWTYAPLVLDTADYSKDGLAPTSFDVIDTSNLMDHLGCLNILTATASLIRQNTTSTLRTEMLVPREGNVADSVKKFLCGDLPTVALLLGLRPVQYWTNATSTWHMNQSPFGDLSSASSGEVVAAMSRPIVLWKPLSTTPVRYDADDLTRLLLSIYLEMFQDESWANRFSMLGLQNKELMLKKLTSYEVYTRASFAVLLRHIKMSNVVDWPYFIRMLVEQGIMTDSTLNMGPHHFQSLFVHLDMLDVWNLDKHMSGWHPRSFLQDLKGIFRNWQDTPSFVCVTIVVPHTAVSMFDDINKGNGTPLCQLQIRSSVSPNEAYYPDIQMGFGTIEESGSAFTNDYAVTVREDTKGWKGSSALIVSAMVSTGCLVEYGDQACNVVFALKATPAATARFSSKLGFMLHIHRSAVGRKDVFVTRYRPNMKGHASVSTATTSKPTNVHDANVIVYPSMKANATEISSLRVRLDVVSEKAKTLLQNGGVVKFEAPNPFRMVLTIDGKFRKDFMLPLPLDTNSAKTKIARKSLWIEYTAQVAELKSLTLRPDYMFPFMANQAPEIALEQLHYVYADVLPKLHIGQNNSHAKWVSVHTSPLTTMSSEENRVYDRMMANKSLPIPGRLGVKESLHSMYAHVFGLSGQAQSRIIQLCAPAFFFGVIYVNSVRMDISNQTVFMDAALVPVHSGPEMGLIHGLLSVRSELGVGILMKDDEVTFWKHLLPAFAERCRQWQHKPSCEYKTAGRIPISTDIDKPYMCSCGFGVFPNNYLNDIKESRSLLKHAVRVAVPVIFASPISPDNAGDVPSSASIRQPAVSATPQQNGRAAARIDDLDTKKDSCFACGAKTAKDGALLMKCSGCKFAQYCSADCQMKDWKAGHKQICKQLKQMYA